MVTFTNSSSQRLLKGEGKLPSNEPSVSSRDPQPLLTTCLLSVHRHFECADWLQVILSINVFSI